MTERWGLVGYDLGRLLGSGTTGEVWRARERASGEPVALRRLRGLCDLDVVTARMRLLQEVQTPYLVRPRAVLAETDGGVVIVLDLATGGSVAAMLERRRQLSPGEVVTVAAPVAQALAALHAAGFAHGRVGASEVLLTDAGMPLLSGMEVPARDGGSADSASDVRALAGLCRQMLTGGDPGQPRGAGSVRLLEAVNEAMRSGGDAAAFAAALRQAHPAEPVDLAGWASVAVEPPRRTRRALVAAGLAVAIGVVAGWSWGHRGPQLSAPPLSAPAVDSPAPVDWSTVLEGLDASRAAALALADPAGLLDVYAPGSPGLAADTAVVARLRSVGHRALGVRHSFRTVTPSTCAGPACTLRVEDTLSSYDVVDARGRVVARVPARRAATFVLRLVETSQGWRVREISRVA